MKFYELDLRKIIPNGVPLNTEPHVEYTNYINDFFLQGFEKYFSRLFTTNNDELVTDYSRSCTAPNTIYACQFCTDAQIAHAITDAGIIYYPENDHAINAQFMYDLSHTQWGTEGWLASIARYVGNNLDVTAKSIHKNKPPYCYGIYLSGDIVTSTNVATIMNRLIDNLKILGTAHTKVDELIFEDTLSNVEANTAVVAIDANISCDVQIKMPEFYFYIYISDLQNSKIAVIKGLKDTFNIDLKTANTIASSVPVIIGNYSVTPPVPWDNTADAAVVVETLNTNIRKYQSSWQDGSIVVYSKSY